MQADPSHLLPPGQHGAATYRALVRAIRTLHDALAEAIERHEDSCAGVAAQVAASRPAEDARARPHP